jgi:hypothetical protein
MAGVSSIWAVVAYGLKIHTHNPLLFIYIYYIYYNIHSHLMHIISFYLLPILNKEHNFKYIFYISAQF